MMKFVFRLVCALALCYFAYDYYHIRQDALCAHNTVVARGMHP